MPWAMSPDSSYISTFMYFSVYIDVEMIAYVWPTSTVNVPFSYGVYAYFMAFSSAWSVYDNLFYLSHVFLSFHLLCTV